MNRLFSILLAVFFLLALAGIVAVAWITGRQM